ncbi:hypothetical protein ScPMuIL_012453 [Solemya velum]
MDADGLPLVGAGIDYTKVEAIQQKRTIAFLNHFITHTAKFLNRFSCVCEEKLEKLSNRIQQLEITLSILEAKLSSIPGLENVTVATTASTDTESTSVTSTSTTTTVTTSQPQPQPTQVTTDSQAPPPPLPPEPEPAHNPVSKDPSYIRFFKMLQVGVPPPAIKIKMAAEGLIPDLLDTPDAPAPSGGVSQKKDSDDDGDDDDDDEDEDGSDKNDSDVSDFSD